MAVDVLLASARPTLLFCVPGPFIDHLAALPALPALHLHVLRFVYGAEAEHSVQELRYANGAQLPCRSSGVSLRPGKCGQFEAK